MIDHTRGDYDFEGLRAPKAHLDTVLTKPVTAYVTHLRGLAVGCGHPLYRAVPRVKVYGTLYRRGIPYSTVPAKAARAMANAVTHKPP